MKFTIICKLYIAVAKKEENWGFSISFLVNCLLCDRVFVAGFRLKFINILRVKLSSWGKAARHNIQYLFII